MPRTKRQVTTSILRIEMGIILFIIKGNSIINYKFYKKLKTKGNKFIKLTFIIENRSLKVKKMRISSFPILPHMRSYFLQFIDYKWVYHKLYQICSWIGKLKKGL